MSGISSIAPSAPHAPPPRASGKGDSTSSTLTTDKKAAKDADATETKADAQLLADKKAKAAASTIRTDQQTLTTATKAANTADAKVQADENASTSLDISV